MREVIIERHGSDGPATTRSNKSSEPIDGIWATQGVSIVSGGYLPFHHIVRSDHQLIWIRISYSHTLGSCLPPTRRPAARDLWLEDRKKVSAFNSVSKKIHKEYNLQERLSKLTDSPSFPPDDAEAAEYEAIDRVRCLARKTAVRKVKKVYRSGVASHPDIKNKQLLLRLADLILNRRDGKQVKWRTITRLADRLGRQEWFTEPSDFIKEQRILIRREYYRLKKTTGKSYSTYLEEVIKENELDGDTKEVTRLHAALTHVKSRERAARLRALSEKASMRGISTVTVETLLLDENKQPVLSADGSPTTQPETFSSKADVERAIMNEIDGRSRMSQGSPPMTEPLVNLLHFHGMTRFGDEILKGIHQAPQSLDSPSKILLENLQAVNSSLPEPALPFPFQKYLKEVGLLRERTSSGSSDVTPAMVKAEVQDPELLSVNWMASNYTWCSGYSPERFRQGLDLPFHKTPGDIRAHRLRPIKLFDIEGNMHNKRLGRHSMELAEACNGVAPEQYGSRKCFAADIQALNTRLFYDLVKLDKLPATSTFIDLVSNYDLVVHSIASLSLQRVGTPKPPIFCTFSTLQDMVSHVRTAYGDSTCKYGGELWAIPFKPPPQGLGQGNGAAPTIWALVSTPILNALRKAGYGAAFKCSISGEEFRLVGYCFVDDSTIVQIAPSPDTPIRDIVHMAQQEIDLYAGLAQATGGQISPVKGKNSWYLLDFAWDNKGGWKLVDRTAELWVDTSGGWKKIERLSCSTASRILGVWMAPDGSSKQQATVLREKAEKWADRVRAGHIKSEDAWHHYVTTIKKTLEYPLVATTLSQSQCKHIEAPSLAAALQSSGLPSNFPRDVIRGSSDLLGLDCEDLYTTQGLKHIRALLDFGESESITGKSLRAGIQKHKVETGLGMSLFEQDIALLNKCVTETWFTHVWRFLQEKGIILVEKTANLQLQRMNDSFIIEIFLRAGYYGQTLALLNRCRMFMKVVTLSDISSGDGKRILGGYFSGECRNDRSQYEWPPQAKPDRSIWELWQSALETCFSTNKNGYLPADNHLGKWLPNAHLPPTCFSESQNRLFSRHGSQWQSYLPPTQSLIRPTTRRFHPDLPVTRPPEDALPCICTKQVDGLQFMGWAPTLPARQELRPTTLIPHSAELAPEVKWALDDISSIDGAEYVAQAIEAGTAIAVSDGSFKTGVATAACCIEGEAYGFCRVSATCLTPGHQDDHDPYRAKLSGILMIICVVERICVVFGIVHGQVTIACDGLEAIKKAVDSCTHYSCRSNQFDLITAIDNKLKKSSLNWRWRHVKGHQDDNIGPLDRWATMNVEMDCLAKRRRRKEESMLAKDPQLLVQDEGWSLFVKETFGTDRDSPGIQKISTKLPEQIRQVCRGRPVLKYWESHGALPAGRPKDMHWKAIHRARNKIQFPRRKWASRLAADFLPTGVRMHERKEWHSPDCPLSCGCTGEDSFHVLHCNKLNSTWDALAAILHEWGRKAGAAPGLIPTMTGAISNWRSAPDATPPTHCSPAVPAKSRPQYEEALQAQNKIGWKGFLLGMISPCWADIQDAHFKAKASRRSGNVFAACLIRKLWDATWDLWQARNHLRKSGLSANQIRLVPMLHSRLSHHHRQGMRGLPPWYALLFRCSLSLLLSKSLRQQLAWFEAVASARTSNARRTADSIRPDLASDMKLLGRFVKEGLVQKLAKVQQFPRLRTTSRISDRQFEKIQREWEDDPGQVTVTILHGSLETRSSSPP